MGAGKITHYSIYAYPDLGGDGSSDSYLSTYRDIGSANECAKKCEVPDASNLIAGAVETKNAGPLLDFLLETVTDEFVHGLLEEIAAAYAQGGAS